MNSLDVCKCAIAILFNVNKDSLKSLRLSFIETQSSLLSELSYINNHINLKIPMSYNLIDSQFISYLEEELLRLRSVTLTQNVLDKLSLFITGNASIYTGTDNEKLSMDLKYAGDKLRVITDSDIGKTQAIRPILQSKTTDFILSVKEELALIVSECDAIKAKIKDCELFIEAIDFCIFYFLSEMSGDEAPSILENRYEDIMSELSVKYSKWKGLI